MKIAVSGGKGGTGKSFVATGLAIADAKQRKTLLLDADVECPNSHVLLGARMRRIKGIKAMLPVLDEEKCKKCGACARSCIKKAITAPAGFFPVISSDMCIGCGACIATCPNKALSRGEKTIGEIKVGNANGISIVTGELGIGEPASGDTVTAVKAFAIEKAKREGAEDVIIDCAAGIGCPVIASIAGADIVVAVTEPMPAALHDLERIWRLAKHFSIPCCVVINKATLSRSMAAKVARFAKSKGMPVIGRIPYSKKVVRATVSSKPIALHSRKYFAAFSSMLEKARKAAGN